MHENVTLGKYRFWQAMLMGLVLLAGCEQGGQVPQANSPAGAKTPEAAMTDLLAHLRRNELAEWAEVALPPALHAEVEAAWRRGESRWPLTELPLDDNIPKLLQALNQPAAEAALQRSFRQQLSGQTRALQDAARGLGVFGKEYLAREGSYNAAQRQHYTQLVGAFADWAATAPLGDAQRGRQSISLLVKGAERSGIEGEEDFSRLGMSESLRALVPLYIAIKQMLDLYGLSVDATLAAVRVETLSQSADQAVIRLHYPLAGQTVETQLEVRKVDGHWYLADYLEAAKASLAAPDAGQEAAQTAPEGIADAAATAAAGR